MEESRRCNADAFGEGALAHVRRRADAASEHLLSCHETVAKRDVFEPVWVPFRAKAEPPNRRKRLEKLERDGSDGDGS
jgi:hypothetical protein